jgi:hypothetical protein
MASRRRYGAKAKDDGPTRGVTAEDLVRFLAWHAVLETIDYPWGAGTNWPPLGKALGVDVVKIRDEVSPADEKVQAKPRKRGTKKSKG